MGALPSHLTGTCPCLTSRQPLKPPVLTQLPKPYPSSSRGRPGQRQRQQLGRQRSSAQRRRVGVGARLHLALRQRLCLPWRQWQRQQLRGCSTSASGTWQLHALRAVMREAGTNRAVVRAAACSSSSSTSLGLMRVMRRKSSLRQHSSAAVHSSLQPQMPPRRLQEDTCPSTHARGGAGMLGPPAKQWPQRQRQQQPVAPHPTNRQQQGATGSGQAALPQLPCSPSSRSARRQEVLVMQQQHQMQASSRRILQQLQEEVQEGCWRCQVLSAAAQSALAQHSLGCGSSSCGPLRCSLLATTGASCCTFSRVLQPASAAVVVMALQVQWLTTQTGHHQQLGLLAGVVVGVRQQLLLHMLLACLMMQRTQQ